MAAAAVKVINKSNLSLTMHKKGRYFSCLTKSTPEILTSVILKREEKELEWLCGFSEAESSFNISTTGALKFKIKLHSDDRNTLLYIQNLLSRLGNRTVGVIVDSKIYHESYYSVDKFQDILEIIIPIFTKSNFTTSKYWYFMDFKGAAGIKRVSFLEKRKLNDEELQYGAPLA